MLSKIELPNDQFESSNGVWLCILFMTVLKTLIIWKQVENLILGT